MKENILRNNESHYVKLNYKCLLLDPTLFLCSYTFHLLIKEAIYCINELVMQGSLFFFSLSKCCP